MQYGVIPPPPLTVILKEKVTNQVWLYPRATLSPEREISPFLLSRPQDSRAKLLHHSSGTGALNAISSRFGLGEQRDKETVGEDERGIRGFCFQTVNDKASLPHVISSLFSIQWPSFLSLALIRLSGLHTHTTLVMANHLDGLPKPQQ